MGSLEQGLVWGEKFAPTTAEISMAARMSVYFVLVALQIVQVKAVRNPSQLSSMQVDPEEVGQNFAQAVDPFDQIHENLPLDFWHGLTKSFGAD